MIMTKNPLLNAVAAVAYIAIVASVMFYGEHAAPQAKSVIVPITILSLFSLSAAVMACIFGFQPIQLYLDGKKKIAVQLFLQTVAVFALITILLLFLLFSGALG